MLKLKEQIFGKVGYSVDMKLLPQELEVFRACVSEHWLARIKDFYPEAVAEAEKLGIENYHQIEYKMDHKKLWSKQNRVFPQKIVNRIKELSLFSRLRDEFGEFSVSDVIDTEQRFGWEEIYWRLVRPKVESDIGPLHKDSWFHGAINGGYGMYTKDQVTVKVWIPIFCEPGKSGLALASGSHLREWKYHIEEDQDGYLRPIPDEDLSTAGAALIPTEPGNLLIFNENVLHGGVINNSDKTRVSAEITMVMQKNNFKDLMSSLTIL